MSSFAYTTSTSESEIEDDFVNLTLFHPISATNPHDKFYTPWVLNSSAPHSSPAIFGAALLRKLYPKHSLVTSSDFNLDILGFPAAKSTPLDPNTVIANTTYKQLGRKIGTVSGVLADSVDLGSFKTIWNNKEFIVYIARWIVGSEFRNQHFILHEGLEEAARELLLGAGAYSYDLHEEIWVYNQSWRKDHDLWVEVQKGSWDDVILKEDFKKKLQDDIYSFFDAEETYKRLSLPWKRGIILHGPPGNGKTASIKAIMKTLLDRDTAPLYVKSFKSFMGEEYSMAMVFNHARKNAPCVLVLEDLDSLINSDNRSFFLNQLDGLEGNDGLLVIGTTNHFDRLDIGLSKRPSRFDRQYLFDDPDYDSRVLYAQYWQNRLSDNKSISFPDSLVTEIAATTDGFSFAYLKEVFVSALVLLVSGDVTFDEALRSQIKELRKQMDTLPKHGYRSSR